MVVRRLVMTLSLAFTLSASGVAAYANSSGVAVIIGNRHYQGAVPEVSYAHRDADAFKRYVVDALGYDPDNILDLRDATQAQMVATFGNQASAQGNLWSYLDPAGGSDVVVFYSGHGVPGQRDGKGYLLPADADPNVPELNAYPIDLLYSNLAKLDEAGSVAVFLDACFSGGSQRGMLIENASPVYVTAALPNAVAGAMTVLTAASGGQLASWDTAARHGMFTHHLLDALYGKGDADGDGSVSATEAKRYLDRHMTRAARRTYKRNQVASLLGDGDRSLAFSGDTGFGTRPALGPGGASPGDIEELDGVRWAKQRTNLRRGPSTEHPVAGSLAAGEEVVVKGQVRGGEWLLVATAQGGEAFVFARLLDDQPPSAHPPPSAPAPARDAALEAAFWESVKDGDASGFEAYLQQFPSGTFAPLALARLQELVWVPMEKSNRLEAFEEYLASNPDGRFAELAVAALRQRVQRASKSALDGYLARYPQGAAAEEARQRAATLVWPSLAGSLRVADFDAFLRRYPNSREAALVPSARAAAVATLASNKGPFDGFVEEDGIWVGRDCPDCPEMVVVPAGSFMMGSPSHERGRDEDEGPVHEVTMGAPFAVGRYEVTFEEWDACARDRGCPRHKDIAKDRGWGRGRRPVIYMSWGDAKRYVRWLAEKTKKPYRLLSESEWEYAARAGTETAYSWGDAIGVNLANCEGCGSRWDDSKTAPVGSFGTNAWGLHDMHGNVREWTEDCWNGSYRGAPSDGSAWLSGNCGVRVLRGGAWDLIPAVLRAADRDWDATGDRSLYVGFRVARTLTP